MISMILSKAKGGIYKGRRCLAKWERLFTLEGSRVGLTLILLRMAKIFPGEILLSSSPTAQLARDDLESWVAHHVLEGWQDFICVSWLIKFLGGRGVLLLLDSGLEARLREVLICRGSFPGRLMYLCVVCSFWFWASFKNPFAGLFSRGRQWIL